MNWDKLRRELQSTVTSKLGGDWLAVFSQDTQAVIVVHTGKAVAANLFAAAEIFDGLHTTDELTRRLESIKASNY